MRESEERMKGGKEGRRCMEWKGKYEQEDKQKKILHF